MKPMEVKAAKEVLRAEIDWAREQLLAQINKPHRIPQRIINAPLSEVIEFKQRAETIGKERVITAPPPEASFTQADAGYQYQAAGVLTVGGKLQGLNHD